MKMVIRNTDKNGQPTLESGRQIEGTDCLALVEQMRAQTPFTARQTPDEYMEDLLTRLPDKQPLPACACPHADRRGGTPEERAADFLSALATNGYVEFVADKADDAVDVTLVLEDPGPVHIPGEVLDDLEIIRRDGRTNMLDWPTVARIADAMGMDKTAAWVRTHQRDYSAGIFRGFAADKKGDPSCADK